MLKLLLKKLMREYLKIKDEIRVLYDCIFKQINLIKFFILKIKREVGKCYAKIFIHETKGYWYK